MCPRRLVQLSTDDAKEPKPVVASATMIGDYFSLDYDLL
jgi:hypothetical protein